MKYFHALLLITVLAAAPARAQTSASIDFAPPGLAQQGGRVTISATLNSGVPPAYASLFIRPIGQASYLPLVLRVNGSQLQGDIPSAMLVPPGVEYYLSVTDIDNQTVTFPPASPAANPLSLPVEPRPTVFALSAVYPSSGSVVAEARPLVHIEFNQVGGGLAPGTFHAYVDGMDITPGCQFEEGEAFCQMGWDLGIGSHTLLAGGQSREQQWAMPLSYGFTRAEGARRVFDLHGRASAGMSYVSLTRKPDNIMFIPLPVSGDRYLPEIEAAGSGYLGGLEAVVAVKHTGIDRQEQPSPDRYSVSLSGRRWGLDLGDFRGSWTDLGLSQAQLRGARIKKDFASRKLFAEAFGGQARRAIFIREYNSGVYARYLYGASALWKAGERLSLRVYGLSGRDDGGSLPAGTAAVPAGSRVGGAELAAGLGGGLSLTNEMAFSGYSRNLRGGGYASGRALQSRISQDWSLGSWSAAYRDVSPDFASQGNSYLQSDYRGLDAQGALRTPKGGLMLTSSLQTYRDNTDGDKFSTFHLLSHQSNLTVRPFPWAPSLLAGFGEQSQRSYSVVVSEVDNRTRNYMAGLNHAFGRLSAGYTETVTQFRDVSGAYAGADFDSRFHSVNSSLALPALTVSCNAGLIENRQRASGNLTRSFNFGMRLAGAPLRNVNVEINHSGSRGRDGRDTLSNRQLNSSAKAEWRTGRTSFWTFLFEDYVYYNYLRSSQSYRVARYALNYSINF
ncbi:MAG TPA: hypothetical protein DCS63_07505 [Elusimicrobia bacterium]|nr:hypothetical protein [Elusimicrobiota bacterium]